MFGDDRSFTVEQLGHLPPETAKRYPAPPAVDLPGGRFNDGNCSHHLFADDGHGDGVVVLVMLVSSRRRFSNFFQVSFLFPFPSTADFLAKTASGKIEGNFGGNQKKMFFN